MIGATSPRVATDATAPVGFVGNPGVSSSETPEPETGLASAHLARFAAALALLVSIALYGVTLDNRELSLARQISLQTFRADQLETRVVELRLEIQQLQSPERLRELIRTEAAR